jgi:hypothetical protein
MRPEPSPSVPPSLAGLQRALLALVTGREAPGPELRADALVAGDSRASADQRIAVYAHMVRTRLAEALASQFPRLAQRLGAEAFGELARAYFADEPSRHPSLRFVGARLPGWLAERWPDAPVVAGLAALEWARADVFDLVDEPTLTLDDVRAQPPERLGDLPLRLVTAHRLVTVARGTATWWSSPDAEPAPDKRAALEARATEMLVVWREGTSVFHRSVDDPERAALALAAQGTSLGLLCDTLSAEQAEADAIAQVHGWLSTWLADGLLVAATA